MVKQWRCTRCNRLHSPTGLFGEDPDQCKECGYEELEVLGADLEEVEKSTWQRYLSLDSFVLLTMGVAIFNVMSALLGGFINNNIMMYSAGISFPLMLFVAYSVTKRTARMWYVSLVVFLGVFVYGLLVGVGGLTVFQNMGILPTTGALGTLFTTAADPLFIVYGLFYVVFGLVGLALLIGGREEISAFTE